jgi:hypothetical protein
VGLGNQVAGAHIEKNASSETDEGFKGCGRHPDGQQDSEWGKSRIHQ